jgi:hypothetical protein
MLTPQWTFCNIEPASESQSKLSRSATLEDFMENENWGATNGGSSLADLLLHRILVAMYPQCAVTFEDWQSQDLVAAFTRIQPEKIAGLLFSITS